MFSVTVLLGTTAGASGRRDSPCLREEGTREKLHLVTELQDQRGPQLLGKNSQAFSQQVFTEHFLGVLPFAQHWGYKEQIRQSRCRPGL